MLLRSTLGDADAAELLRLTWGAEAAEVRPIELLELLRVLAALLELLRVLAPLLRVLVALLEERAEPLLLRAAAVCVLP